MAVSVSWLLYQNLSFYVADINLKDIDLKVIYHYEEDDYDFVGLHNRSRVVFEEGNLGFYPFYDDVLQDIADQDDWINYSIDFEYGQIRSRYDEDALLDVCLYEIDFKTNKESNDDYLKSTIYFEFDSQLEVSTKMPMIRSGLDLDRRFLLKGEFDITGLYSDRFIDFHIRRIILFKLKYATKDYLLQYHGYRAWYRYYAAIALYSWNVHMIMLAQ